MDRDVVGSEESRSVTDGIAYLCMSASGLKNSVETHGCSVSITWSCRFGGVDGGGDVKVL